MRPSLSQKEREAIDRYNSGESPCVSTFIDEETLTYGYGELSNLGEWEYEIPHDFLTKGEPTNVHELLKDLPTLLN